VSAFVRDRAREKKKKRKGARFLIVCSSASKHVFIFVSNCISPLKFCVGGDVKLVSRVLSGIMVDTFKVHHPNV